MTTDATSTQTVELTLEEIFDQAEAEVEGLAPDTDVDPDSPAGETDADALDEDISDGDETADSEQADADVDQFDFDLEEVEDDTTDTPTLPETVEIEGVGEVPFTELRDGYLRQADYTRKTQALAEEKKAFAQQNEAATKIMENLRDDPVGVAAYLALETGLIKDSDLTETKVAALRDAVKVPKAEEVQAEIDRKVEEALANHPQIQSAKLKEVQAAINAEFAEIEDVVGKPLSEKAKTRIIKYANEHDLNDLRVAFDALSSVAARKRAARDNLKQAATERPGSRKPPRDVSERPVEDINDALEIALAIHGE